MSFVDLTRGVLSQVFSSFGFDTFRISGDLERTERLITPSAHAEGSNMFFLYLKAQRMSDGPWTLSLVEQYETYFPQDGTMCKNGQTHQVLAKGVSDETVEFIFDSWDAGNIEGVIRNLNSMHYSRANPMRVINLEALKGLGGGPR